MEHNRIPKPGELYQHFKGKLYQIITVAIHTETGEAMVVYQALYGDFKTYVRPLAMFISEVDKIKYPDATQQYRFELKKGLEDNILPVQSLSEYKQEGQNETNELKVDVSEAKLELGNETTGKVAEAEEANKVTEADATEEEATGGAVNSLLLKFLDAETYNEKLELIATSRKHLTDRLINDMAVALDITVDEGPLDDRIERLIYSLQTMSRFEQKRWR